MWREIVLEVEALMIETHGHELDKEPEAHREGNNQVSGAQPGDGESQGEAGQRQ
jgi:hypothetical protein